MFPPTGKTRSLQPTKKAGGGEGTGLARAVGQRRTVPSALVAETPEEETIFYSYVFTATNARQPIIWSLPSPITPPPYSLIRCGGWRL